MRKQRYQRYVPQNQDPAQVNVDTSDQDRQLLATQLKGLKAIWANDDEEKKTKKGVNYNAMDQIVKKTRGNLRLWGSTTKELTPEELARREGKEGAQAYIDLAQAHSANKTNMSPLKLAVEGNNTDVAAAIEKNLIEQFGEEDYYNYINYSRENPIPLDPQAEFKKVVNSIPAESYTDDFLPKQGLDPLDYMRPEEVEKLHVDKYREKTEQRIKGLKVTPENAKEMTEKVAKMVKEANLPAADTKALNSLMAKQVTNVKNAQEAREKRDSKELLTAYSRGDIPSLRDFSKLTDQDTKSASNIIFDRNTQKVDDGVIPWSAYKKLPDDPLARDNYLSKYKRKVEDEYSEIAKESSEIRQEFMFTKPENLHQDREFLVELTYNYYNERKRGDSEFTIEDARTELYSNDTPEKTLLLETYDKMDELGLSKEQYKRYFRDEKGREELYRLGLRKKLYLTNKSTGQQENLDVRRTRTKDTTAPTL